MVCHFRRATALEQCHVQRSSCADCASARRVCALDWLKVRLAKHVLEPLDVVRIRRVNPETESQKRRLRAEIAAARQSIAKRLAPARDATDYLPEILRHPFLGLAAAGVGLWRAARERSMADVGIQSRQGQRLPRIWRWLRLAIERELMLVLARLTGFGLTKNSDPHEPD